MDNVENHEFSTFCGKPVFLLNKKNPRRGLFSLLFSFIDRFDVRWGKAAHVIETFLPNVPCSF